MVAAVADRIDALVQQGQLSPEGQATIAAPLASLEALYPSSQKGGHGGDQQGNANG
jgi:hypothetical protein